MKKKRTVLIVEDEVPQVKAIKKGLAESDDYDYQVKVAKSVEDYVKKGFHETPFDIVIADLQLSKGEPWPSGLRILWLVYSRGVELARALTIVYSEHPGEKKESSVCNVIKAMKLGATDFCTKKEYPPHELVARIETHLKDAELRRVERARLNYLLEKNWDQWHADYAGKVVAIVGDDIVASGNGRLEALLEYGEKLKANEGWPELPDFLEIPSEEQCL